MNNLKARLDTLIENDKRINTEKIKSVLKSDFFYLISNFFEVEFEDVIVNIEQENNRYQITIKCSGDKVKFVRSIPE